LHGWDKVERIFSRGKSPIFAFWHGRLLALGYCFRKRGYHILSSESRDGRISITANTFLGYNVIPGSSSHGGSKGLRAITRRARSGAVIGITPDGPRGPRQELQEGVLMVAMATGHPLVPLSSSARHAIHLKSWDRFMVPRPFTDVLVNVGEPFYVPRRLDRDERIRYRERFQTLMNEHQDETDRIIGHEV
jgi:lysophospholipid acyltransferase (LPLAT)-like uncharacterized protein